MLRLNDLKPAPGANQARKRVGRGKGSGLGKTSGSGGKGQTARSGGGKPGIGFEGGQTPLYRRIPKRGFKNFARRNIAIINLKDLEKLSTDLISEISLESLKKIRKIKRNSDKLNILGTGELTKSWKVIAHKVSESAKKGIEKAGGQIQLLVAQENDTKKK